MSVFVRVAGPDIPVNHATGVMSAWGVWRMCVHPDTYRPLGSWVTASTNSSTHFLPRVNHASYIFTEFKNVIWTVSDEFSLQSEAIRSGLQDLELQSARHFQHRLFFHLHNFSNRPLKQCRRMQIMPSTSAISLLDWRYNYYYQRCWDRHWTDNCAVRFKLYTALLVCVFLINYTVY